MGNQYNCQASQNPRPSFVPRDLGDQFTAAIPQTWSIH